MFPPKATRRRVALVWHPYRFYSWDAIHRFVPQQAGVYKLAYPTAAGKLNTARLAFARTPPPIPLSHVTHTKRLLATPFPALTSPAGTGPPAPPREA